MTRLSTTTPYLELLRQNGVEGGATARWASALVDSGATPTVQLAVYRAGDLAFSLAAGSQPPHGQVSRASIYLLYSSSKLFATLVLWALHDRGCFAFDDRIAAHWPEFGAHGKEQITLRQLLSHRAGIRLGPPGTSWGWWDDREQMARFLCGLEPEWTPGEGVGYHNRIFGFLLDHLVWRWTGAGIGAFLRDEICAPLGLADLYLPLPEELFRTRFVRTVPPVQSDQHAAVRRDPQVAADAEFRPRIGDEANLFNAWEIVRQPLAWGTVAATAEGAADVLNFFALRGLHRGLRLFSEATFALGVSEQSRPGEIDRTLGVPARWGLGPQLDPFPGLACSAHSLGHGGGSTVYAWADWEHGLSVCCALSGTPGTPGAAAQWRRSLGESVLADFVAGST